MATILLLRHAQSTWNAERRWQGWADAPLSEEGERQAELAARRLRAEELTSVASSDLRRARRTAEFISQSLGLGPVGVERGLRERDVGEWSGLTAEEVDERWPGQREAWRTGRLNAPPGGESTPALIDRVLEALHKLATAAEPTERLLVVTHGGVIRALEIHVGLHPRGVPVVSGRWFGLDGAKLLPGDAVAVGDME
jgi:broad specificity phosphatase PhoE